MIRTLLPLSFRVTPATFMQRAIIMPQVSTSCSVYGMMTGCPVVPEEE